MRNTIIEILEGQAFAQERDGDGEECGSCCFLHDRSLCGSAYGCGGGTECHYRALTDKERGILRSL